MLLEVSELEVHYGPIRAIERVDISVDNNEVVALIGANGAGKTTTLRAISGLRRPSGGKIIYDGRDISSLEPHQIVKLGVSQSPEGRGIFPGMSVVENLEMGAYIRKGADLSQEFARVYELFPVLHERRKQAGGTLSGGEQQMLAIGRALMSRPKLLLLDEPSMGLAPLKIKQIFEIVTTIREQGTTVLLVEQNAVQALQRSDRAYVLSRGRVILSGKSSDLLDDASIRSAYLGGDLDQAEQK